MTYATKQLTHALQELTSLSHQVEARNQSVVPKVIPSQELQFSKEVETYLEQKHTYAQRTRNVNVGTY